MNEQRFLDALMRNDFLTFASKVFAELNPGRVFIPRWFHEAIADRLEVAYLGQYPRVIINLPPRSAKSTIVTVALPAFLLGRDPTRRFVCVSYNQELANFFSRQTRQVMRSAWYRRLFPSTVLTGAAEARLYTASGGFRKAIGVGGSFTGRGGDVVIIDDPLKADDVYSEAARASLVGWAAATLPSRLDDKIVGSIILVQQRQHEEDLSGHFLRTGEWLSLCLPAIAPEDEEIIIGRNPIRRHYRRKGDLLDPVREPHYILDGLRRDMGSANFAAQYLQAPVPPDGGAIKISWFKTYNDVPDGELVLSVDTASKVGPRNDWSVVTMWRVVDDRSYLLNVWRRQVEYPSLKAVLIDFAYSLRPDAILIEDKGAGTGLIQDMKAEPKGYPVVAHDPGSTDKATRMHVQSAKIEAGQVLIPPSAPWLDTYLDEFRRFLNGKHDDQIDTTSQLLAWHYGRRRNQLHVGSFRLR